jgi:hypothetical protein
MTSETTTFTGEIGKRQERQRIFPRLDTLKRFRRYIEKGDWNDAMSAHDEWIDKLCIGVMIVATLYFTPPVVVMLFWR